MAKAHNFKLMSTNSMGTMRRWACAGCDSVAEMPAKFNEIDVNKKMMMIQNFPCIPPVDKFN